MSHPEKESPTDRGAISRKPSGGSANEPRGLTELDLQRAGISVILWATGYDLDYSWIEAPIFDELHYPRNVRGVSTVPGLYFIGLLWQHSQASASLIGPERRRYEKTLHRGRLLPDGRCRDPGRG